jgi:hypothetical protein
MASKVAAFDVERRVTMTEAEAETDNDADTREECQCCRVGRL